MYKNVQLRENVKKKIKNLRMRVLLNSGCRATLVNTNFVTKNKSVLGKEIKWVIKRGKFSTNRKSEINFTLPAFNAKKELPGIII